MSKQTYRVCFCFQRRFKMAAAEAPEEVKALFGQYSENGIMTVDHLHRFLIDIQKQEKATLQDAQAIFDSLHEFRHLNIFHRKGLNLEGFFKYLFGNINPPLDPKLGVNSLNYILACLLWFSVPFFLFLVIILLFLAN
uniref:Phosphoinositide phospholipase C 2-like n=1 Tax=Rhizophora mucronata TaxID=61149 RepID=A0A2P2LQJ1_RHIMU